MFERDRLHFETGPVEPRLARRTGDELVLRVEPNVAPTCAVCLAVIVEDDQDCVVMRQLLRGSDRRSRVPLGVRSDGIG